MYDIKDIEPASICRIADIDANIYTVEKALATIHTQLDFELDGGLKKTGDLLKERREWLYKAKSAERFAKATLKALESRRELLWEAADAVRAELVALKGDEYVTNIEQRTKT